MQTVGSHYCGASIIGKRWLLTAAHCTRNISDPQEIAVRIGSTDKSSGGRIYRLKRIIPHEKFEVYSKLDFDFALLELEKDIEFSEEAQPIKLANKDQQIHDGTMCSVSGWGDTRNPNESDDKLRAVDVPIFNYQKCVYDMRKFVAVTTRMLCAGYKEGGKDACKCNSINENLCLIGKII